ncbi:hypothetical protein B7494_g4948 [Chlorociboria aeruginascens]|nr:hypothetical protein B7494_g4948 [Chlorociboria aeruginascens]
MPKLCQCYLRLINDVSEETLLSRRIETGPCQVAAISKDCHYPLSRPRLAHLAHPPQLERNLGELSKLYKPTFDAMPKNTRWGDGKNHQSLGSSLKTARVKEVAKSFAKKFGPLLLTAAAAAVEHQLHERDNQKETREQDQEDEREESPPPREWKHRRARLKKSFKRKAKDREDSGESKETSSSIEVVATSSRRDFGSSPDGNQMRPHQEEVLRERHFSKAAFEERKGLPEVPDLHRPPAIVPDSFNRSIYPVDGTSRHQYTERLRHRHSRRRHSSYEDDVFPQPAVGVAALAGFIEALHVSEVQGDWLGSKGVRVGTTVASSYGTTTKIRAAHTRYPDKNCVLTPIANRLVKAAGTTVRMAHTIVNATALSVPSVWCDGEIELIANWTAA